MFTQSLICFFFGWGFPLGIGADDAFIFVKVWRCCIAERTKSSGYNFNSTSSFSSNFSHSDTISDLMGMTLKHAALSMLVTSITTSAAFYASFVSSITAVRCFGWVDKMPTNWLDIYSLLCQKYSKTGEAHYKFLCGPIPRNLLYQDELLYISLALLSLKQLRQV